MKSKLAINAAAVFCLALTVNASAQAKVDIKDEISQSEKSAKVFNEIMSTPDMGIPKELLEGAKCVAVFPSVLKAGFVFGIPLGVTTDSVLWTGGMFKAFGADLIDAKGNVTAKSDAVRQAVDYGKRLVGLGSLPAFRPGSVANCRDDPATSVEPSFAMILATTSDCFCTALSPKSAKVHVCTMPTLQGAGFF